MGALNFLVACKVVRPRLRVLANGMSRLRRALRDEDEYGDGAIARRGSDRFHVPVDDIREHLAGDRILVQTPRAVQAVLREGDLLVPYGGEAFLILLPGANLPESMRVAERVRGAVAAMEIRRRGSPSAWAWAA
jgi:GGDEF domain-containing protein